MTIRKNSWKRGFLEIIAEILDALKENSLKKTHITYKCNLDSRSVSRYLSLMIYLNLIKPIDKKTKYAISQNGLRYLEHYDRMINLLNKNLEKDSIFYQDVKEVISNLKNFK